jgi:hypothetical protein
VVTGFLLSHFRNELLGCAKKLRGFFSEQQKETQSEKLNRRGFDFPRFLELFAFLLPRTTRERVFEPVRQELLEDYLLAKKRYRTKGARRWLAFCFAFRFLLLFLGCIRALLMSKALDWLSKLSRPS